jgi:hypothetical protein
MYFVKLCYVYIHCTHEFLVTSLLFSFIQTLFLKYILEFVEKFKEVTHLEPATNKIVVVIWLLFETESESKYIDAIGDRNQQRRQRTISNLRIFTTLSNLKQH